MPVTTRITSRADKTASLITNGNDSRTDTNGNTKHDTVAHPTTTKPFNPSTVPPHLQILTARSTLLYVITGGIVAMTLTGVLYDMYQYGTQDAKLNIENTQFVTYIALYYIIHIACAHITTLTTTKTSPAYLYIGALLSLTSLVAALNVPTRRSVYRYILMSSFALSSLRWVDLVRRINTTNLHTYDGWYRAIYVMTFCDLTGCTPLCDDSELQKRKSHADQRQYMITQYRSTTIHSVIKLYTHLAVVMVCGATVVLASQYYHRDDLLQCILVRLVRYAFGFIAVMHLLDVNRYVYALMFVNMGVVAHPVQIDPLHSKSITEMWGVRWNKYIQPLLQRHIYTPIYAVTHNRSLAALITFLFSGVWLHCIPAYTAGLSLAQTVSIAAFFAAQAVLTVFEKFMFQQPIQNTGVSRLRTKVLMLCTVPLAIEPIYTLCGI